jgi:hypothetical protein
MRPVGTLGDVIELMQSARTRYSTLDARVRHWSHRERVARASERVEGRTAAGGTATLAWVEGAAAVAAATFDLPDEPLEREWTGRLRVKAPSRWRIDTEKGDEGQIDVGWRWWLEDRDTWPTPDDRRSWPAPDRLEEISDPALLIAETWLEPVGRSEVAVRDAIVVSARPRPTIRAGGMEFLQLDPPGDEYELAVDAERGIVLRLTATFGGEPMEVIEVLSVAFDGPMSDDLFEDHDEED